ncbi:MAG: phosphoribosylformylglycinamidine synthase [Peptococcaceae bacterium 1109]|nr:MAG: phosphoribosylformylglycinamidine synthase [Peptococcaceae bacterium 1109]
MEPRVWRDMGLTDEEFNLITEYLKREPNFLEVGIFSVMWSEHCSYKTSKPLLKGFPTTGPQVLQGPGENAGVVDIGDGLAAAFKIESHNHPSAVEPYQGAATGVGGILRDIFTMGARPIAVLDSLRFGPLEDGATRFLVQGVVAGISGYGSGVGVPTVGGEVYFHPSYQGNPLVNAMAVGLLRHEELVKAAADVPGGTVMIAGSKTGRDGIHGATFASVELTEESEEKVTAVQAGDPFMEKLLMEACLEVMEKGLLLGIQDMGAAGLTSSAAEMASRGGTGIELNLDLVPCREEGMTPYEMMLSESQERMLMVPKPGRDDEVKEVFRRWGVEATEIGKVTADGQFRLLHQGEVVAEIPVRTLTDLSPVRSLQGVEPERYGALKAVDLSDLALHEPPEAVLLRLLASPNIASKEWIYNQYDHRGIPGGDSAVVPIPGTTKALALTTDCNSRYVYLDPYVGSALAVVEAAQNIVCSGGKPLAVTNCLNFGSPEKQEVFWELEQACAGIAAACRALDTPVTGGNVSLYNESGEKPIYPTPIIGMVGIVENASKALSNQFRPGEDIILIGEVEGSLAGSEYLALVEGQEGGALPELDLESIRSRLDFLYREIQGGSITSAHDVVEGGLAVALAEMSGAVGAVITLKTEYPLLALFGERLGRFVATLAPGQGRAFLERAREAGVPAQMIGRTGGLELRILAADVSLKVSICQCQAARKGTLPSQLDPWEVRACL